MNAEDASGRRSLYAQSSRLNHIGHLWSAIDSLIFVQLAILYYHDNLTFLLVLRAATQYLYISGPLPPSSPFTPTIIVNAVCMLTHILHARPEATARSARGYMHGGLVLDFIGEHGPISKWNLIFLDLLILGLQSLILAIGHEQSVAKGDAKQSRPSQDVEAEEAGVRRSREAARASASETEDGIEMQTLLGPEERASSDAGEPIEDVILTLNIRRSLRGLLTAANQEAAEGSEGSSVTDRAADRIDRLRDALNRIAAQRAAQ